MVRVVEPGTPCPEARYSGQSERQRVWVNSWVTHDALIELPRKIEFECQEITEKSWCLVTRNCFTGPVFDSAPFQYRKMSPAVRVTAPVKV